MEKYLSKLTEHEKDEIRKVSQLEIPLWLDSYNDIFSDFDSRHISQRALSVDFLEEAKRASRDKSMDHLSLTLLMPAAKRNPKDEALIRRRLREHFEKHYKESCIESVGMIKKGIMMLLIGIMFMGIATYILWEYQHSTLLTNFLVVLFEPAGWFSFWEGLNLILFKANRNKDTKEFNRKMSKCAIIFMSY